VNAANTAVTCADYKDRFTADGVRKHLPAYRKASPGFGDWTAWAQLQCTGWLVAGQAPTVDVSADGAGPLLVVGNVGDPATPYEGARTTPPARDGRPLTHRTGPGPRPSPVTRHSSLVEQDVSQCPGEVCGETLGRHRGEWFGPRDVADENDSDQL
jgi:hypothetical protein